MKALKLLTIVACVGIVVFTAKAFFRQSPPQTLHTGNANQFAVIELFTSEGCSSCPTADALVAKIESENTNQPVYILAFHVDYWDRLGWKDMFSSPDFSERQRKYADWLKLESVYTPQIVINGQKEFVGSQESTLRSELAAKIKTDNNSQLTISNLKENGNKATLDYNAENVPISTLLAVAVIQKAATVNVKSGENGGRTLAHVQIVRKFITIPLKATNKGNVSIDLPANLSLPNLEIISFLQNTTNGKIIAATKVAF